MRNSLPSRRLWSYHPTYEYTLSGNIFTSATTSQNFTVVNVPAGWAVQSLSMRLITQFAGVSLAGLVLKMGTSANANIFAPDFSLIQTALPTTVVSYGFVQASTIAHDIIARFVSTGASINAINAGKVELTVNIGPV